MAAGLRMYLDWLQTEPQVTRICWFANRPYMHKAEYAGLALIDENDRLTEVGEVYRSFN